MINRRRVFNNSEEYQQVLYIKIPESAYCTIGCITTIPYDPYGTYIGIVSIPKEYPISSHSKSPFSGIVGFGNDINISAPAYKSSTSSWNVSRKSDSGTVGEYNINDGHKYTVKFICDRNGLKLEIYDEAQLVLSNTNWRTPVDIEGVICIGNNTGLWSSGAWVGYIYKLEAYNKNGELYAEFIPCYKKSDKKVGFLDTFSGKFFEFLPYEHNPLNVLVGPEIN